MRFLIVRTDIRAAADDELAAAWAQGECLRDEQTTPEQRRQVVRAEDRDAALLLARALSSVGAVRAGRQRVKVLPVGEPERRRRDNPVLAGSRDLAGSPNGLATPHDLAVPPNGFAAPHDLAVPPDHLTAPPSSFGAQPDNQLPVPGSPGPRPANTGALDPRLGLPT